MLLQNMRFAHSDSAGGGSDVATTNQAFTHMLMYYHHLAQLTAAVQQQQQREQHYAAAGMVFSTKNAYSFANFVKCHLCFQIANKSECERTDNHLRTAPLQPRREQVVWRAIQVHHRRITPTHRQR